jgi:condensin complex subunit 2
MDLEEQMRQEICEEAMPEGGAGVPLRGKMRARQSLTGDLDQLDMFIGVDDDYSYFSKEAARAWAGPEHWSFRKGPAKPLAALPRAADADGDGGYTQEDGAAQDFTSSYAKGKKGGKKKEPFFLDLTGPPPADLQKKMAKSKASTQLAVVKGAKESEINTLPEDLRYSVDTLRRLFLRPRTRVTLRQSHYYRQSANFGDGGDMDGGDDDGDFCAMEEAPEDWGPPKDPSVPELPQFGLLEAPRRAQKIEISYARTAKKVDIKALKDDLWESIDSINPASKQAKSKGVKTTPVEFMEETKQALPFSDTISKLDVNKCPDVSISYCFICLLHLANEKNLAILGEA